MPPKPKAKPEAAPEPVNETVAVLPEQPGEFHQDERPVVWDVEVPVVFIAAAKHGTALTVEQVQAMLGWQEETDVYKFGNDFQFLDHFKKKIRCTKNMCNRPLRMDWVYNISQRHLRGRWRGLNGETIVIDKYDDIQSAQHRLIGFLLAEQLRQKNAEWSHLTEPLTMEAVIVYGIESDSETINTLDTGKPRLLEDVLYRSPYFASLPTKERKIMSRATQWAIMTAWKRTGANLSLFTEYPDWSEYIEFLERHQHLIKAVEFVVNANKNGCLEKIMGLGYWSALMYLMAASKSDLETYLATDPHRSEHVLDFSRWPDAERFIKEAAHTLTVTPGVSEFKPMLDAIASLTIKDEETTATLETASLEEKLAIVVKTWYLFIDKKKISREGIRLRYLTDDELHTTKLMDYPTVGGIDRDKDELNQLREKLGKHVQEQEPEQGEEGEQPADPEPKESDVPRDDMGFPITYVEPGEAPTEAAPESKPTPKPKPTPKAPAYVLTEDEKKLAAERQAQTAKKKGKK